jgi:hypothetical protein
MFEMQPALLTKLELGWLLGKANNLSKKTERDLRYRINKKVRILMNTELPLLKDRGFAAALCSDAAAISSGSSIEEHRLVGRGIDNPEMKSNKVVSDKKDKGAGSGNIVSIAPFSSVPPRHFEPTCPFGHGISNPTPYQARRPPLVRYALPSQHNINVAFGGYVFFHILISRSYLLAASCKILAACS